MAWSAWPSVLRRISGSTSASRARLAALCLPSCSFQCKYTAKGKYRGEWSYEADTAPTYTARNLMLEDTMNSPAAYAIYSCAVHADWHSVVGNWAEGKLLDGSKAVIIRPDRIAVCGAAIAPHMPS
jgi:hypothetical protein